MVADVRIFAESRQAAEVPCVLVGTDIYGGIEYRHPGAGSDWYEGEP